MDDKPCFDGADIVVGDLGDFLHGARQHPESIYPADACRTVQNKYDPRFLRQHETMCSLANGYLGMRGICKDVTRVLQHETFVNGCCESRPIVYGEVAFGFAKI